MKSGKEAKEGGSKKEKEKGKCGTGGRGNGPTKKGSREEEKQTQQDNDELERLGLSWEWVSITNIPTVKHISKGARKEWGEVLGFLLRKVVDEPRPERNWRMLMALPKMCLRAPPRGGRKRRGRSSFKSMEWTQRLLMRARRGEWKELLEEAREAERKIEKKQGRKKKSQQGERRRVKDRVIGLVAEGQFSRACKALVSEGVWELDEKVIEQLKEKHPQGEGWKKVDDKEPMDLDTDRKSDEEAEGQGRVEFSASQVEKALRAFPKGTAPGGSGGRAQHWLDALDGMVGEGRKEMLSNMASVCEFLANGEAPQEIAPWLAGAPLFPLKKKGRGIRPVAVGEFLRRLVAKMLANDGKVREKAEKLFAEVGQFGVAVKGGAEIVVQAVRTWLGKKGKAGMGVLKFDFENAYNTVSREEIANKVAEFFPELLPWFKFCYGTPAILSCQGKRLPFESRDGVQQGDPLGPLFFALGILRMGRVLKEGVKEALPLWYLDDGSVVGSGEDLLRAWELVLAEAKKIGMKLNEEKCEVWAWEGKQEKWMERFPPKVRRLQENGFEMLGAPVGDKKFSEKYVRGRVDKIREVLDKLEILDDPQVELSLLRSCLGFPRFGFSLRSAPPSHIENAVKEFDGLMNEVAQKRFHVSLTADKEKQ